MSVFIDWSDWGITMRQLRNDLIWYDFIYLDFYCKMLIYLSWQLKCSYNNIIVFIYLIKVLLQGDLV